ncbi:MAG: hypothetical protein RLZ62_1999 [Bacteroidota bacterium]
MDEKSPRKMQTFGEISGVDARKPLLEIIQNSIAGSKTAHLSPFSITQLRLCTFKKAKADKNTLVLPSAENPEQNSPNN